MGKPHKIICQKTAFYFALDVLGSDEEDDLFFEVDENGDAVAHDTALCQGMQDMKIFFFGLLTRFLPEWYISKAESASANRYAPTALGDTFPIMLRTLSGETDNTMRRDSQARIGRDPSLQKMKVVRGAILAGTDDGKVPQTDA